MNVEAEDFRRQIPESITFNGIPIFPPSRRRGIPIATLETEYPLRYQA